MTTPLLRLAALDAHDLAVFSAHVQDAVAKPAEASWSASTGRFLMPMNRFAWEAARRGGSDQRRRAVLHFDRVTRVQIAGTAPDAADAVSVLAILFEPGDAPAGRIIVACSGNVTIRLDAECIEARLTDVGAVWSASMRPQHMVR